MAYIQTEYYTLASIRPAIPALDQLRPMLKTPAVVFALYSL